MQLESQLRAMARNGQLKQAAALCQQELNSNPNSFSALDFMARFCVQTGQFGPARQFLQRILRSDAEFDRLRYLRLTGEVCGKARDWEGAMNAYREILESLPADLEARVNVTSLLLRFGDYASAHSEAESMLQQIAGSEPEELAASSSALGNCIYRLADLFKESRATELLSLFSSLRDAEQCGFLEEDFNYWFGLGLLCDASGDPEQALSAFRRANTLRRARTSYDASAHLQEIRSLTTRFDNSWFDSPIAAREEEEPIPVFIVGMPRTGSTLVEQILGRHSAIEPLGELDALNAALREALQAGSANGWSLSEPDSLDSHFFQQVRRAYFEKSQPGPGRYFTDKMPWNLLYIWLIAKVFPSARIIYMQRDKLPTVMSCFSTNFGEDLRFTESIEESVHFFEAFENVARAWSPQMGARMTTQNYERLVRDPGHEIQRLMAFLDLELEPGCLEPHKSERTVPTTSMMQVTKPIYVTGNERWEAYRELLGADRALFNRSK